MEAKRIIFAQKSARNNLNFGLNSMHVSREKAVSSLRLAIGLAAQGIRAVTGSESLRIDRLREHASSGAVDGAWPTGIIT
jgi:hypothetical protein